MGMRIPYMNFYIPVLQEKLELSGKELNESDFWGAYYLYILYLYCTHIVCKLVWHIGGAVWSSG